MPAAVPRAFLFLLTLFLQSSVFNLIYLDLYLVTFLLTEQNVIWILFLKRGLPLFSEISIS